MAMINVGEDDFVAAAYAAQVEWDHGSRKVAAQLDKLARKINAALATQRTHRRMGHLAAGFGVQKLRWQDVPSTITK